MEQLSTYPNATTVRTSAGLCPKALVLDSALRHRCRTLPWGTGAGLCLEAPVLDSPESGTIGGGGRSWCLHWGGDRTRTGGPKGQWSNTIDHWGVQPDGMAKMGSLHLTYTIDFYRATSTWVSKGILGLDVSFHDNRYHWDHKARISHGQNKTSKQWISKRQSRARTYLILLALCNLSKVSLSWWPLLVPLAPPNMLAPSGLYSRLHCTWIAFLRLPDSNLDSNLNCLCSSPPALHEVPDPTLQALTSAPSWQVGLHPSRVNVPPISVWCCADRRRTVSSRSKTVWLMRGSCVTCLATSDRISFLSSNREGHTYQAPLCKWHHIHYTLLCRYETFLDFFFPIALLFLFITDYLKHFLGLVKLF